MGTSLCKFSFDIYYLSFGGGGGKEPFQNKVDKYSLELVGNSIFSQSGKGIVLKEKEMAAVSRGAIAALPPL